LGQPDKDQEALVNQLYQQIGQLKSLSLYLG
jgi:hypothetical protein